jgi:hypothetical protein
MMNAGPESARRAEEFLRAIVPEGGSDVTGAILQARQTLPPGVSDAARVIYVGDGTPTIGAVSAPLIRREISRAIADGGTVSAVAIGADADTDTLSSVAEVGGGIVVPYSPGESVADVAYAALRATYGNALREPSVVLPEGLTEVVPRRLATVSDGGETLIYARMDRPVVEGTVTLRGQVGSTPFEQRYPLRIEATSAKGNAFVPRLWAAAKIAELEKDGDSESRRRAVELSGRFHVGSRYTSLLVLESAAMFRAFGLNREDRVALWTGETDATSTTADGASDDATAAPDDRTGALDLYMRDDGAGRGLGTASGKAKASDDELAREPAPMPAAKAAPRKEYAQPPAAAPSPMAAALNAPAEDGAVYTEQPRTFAPPPPAMPGLGTAGGAYEVRHSPPFGLPPGEIPLPRPRRMIPMRKVWDRVGHIVWPPMLPGGVSPEALARAESDFGANPLRRDALKRLYTLEMLRGDLDRAGDLAEQWSAKDPLDPDALTARADVAAARGERDRAIRILGSVVDVRPGDHKSQWRLARLHRWAGRPELGCRHSLAVAQIRVGDANLLVEAVRCARDLGHEDVVSDLMAAANDATRRAAEAGLAVPAPDPSLLSGDLRVEASWDGGDDLDLSMLPPDGNRVSWLGAPTHAVIGARDVQSRLHEGLSLRGGAPGDYVIEITRPSGHTGILHGTADITAAGDRRSVPFVLEGSSVRVALVRITTKSRLVPL